MSDLPPYLSSLVGRNIRWKQHSTFPRNVIRVYLRDRNPWHSDLRIFKREYGPAGVEYILMSETEVQKYMDDPTHV